MEDGDGGDGGWRGMGMMDDFDSCNFDAIRQSIDRC